MTNATPHDLPSSTGNSSNMMEVDNIIPDVHDVTPSHHAQTPAGRQFYPQGQMLKIPVSVRVILGSTKMSLAQAMALEAGSIVTLEQRLSEPVLLEVNGREVARGMIVLIDEKSGQLGLSLTQIASEASASEAGAARHA